MAAARSRPPSKVNGFSGEPVRASERPYIAPASAEPSPARSSTTAAAEGSRGVREASFDDIIWGGHQYGAQVSVDPALTGDSPVDDIEALMEEYDAVKDPKSWFTIALMVLMFGAFGLGVWFLYLAFFGDAPQGLTDFFKTVSEGLSPKTPKISD